LQTCNPEAGTLWTNALAEDLSVAEEWVVDGANTVLDLMIAEAATVSMVAVTATADHAGVTVLEALRAVLGRQSRAEASRVMKIWTRFQVVEVVSSTTKLLKMLSFESKAIWTLRSLLLFLISITRYMDPGKVAAFRLYVSYATNVALMAIF
jgi:hypothetical protein